MNVVLTQSLVVLASVVLGGVWPLQPRPEVVAGFDPPAQRWDSGHRGVDLLGQPGQQVGAAADGTVTYAGLVAGRGVVVVSHGDTRTTYQPVAASVSVGDLVTAGQRIGTLQSGGTHCPPRVCLHWGLVRGATYLDPLTLVGPSPVRLLPLFSPYPVLTGPPTGMFAPAQPVVLPPRRTARPVVPWVRPGGVPAGRPPATGPW